MVATGWTVRTSLPTVSKFRYEAGNPDDAGRTDGLNNTQSLTAIRRIWPTAGATSFIKDIEALKVPLRAGAVASVSIKSSLLPVEYRHGFLGLHQVAVAIGATGLVIMNPLNKASAAPPRISWANLAAAAYGVYDDGKVHAVIVPMKPVATPPPDPHLAEIAALKAKVSGLEAANIKLTGEVAALNSKIASARAMLL
jgi:hypothetical protein